MSNISFSLVSVNDFRDFLDRFVEDAEFYPTDDKRLIERRSRAVFHIRNSNRMEPIELTATALMRNPEYSPNPEDTDAVAAFNALPDKETADRALLDDASEKLEFVVKHHTHVYVESIND